MSICSHYMSDTLERMTRFDTVGFEVITRFN